jgi:hypothetical protein
MAAPKGHKRWGGRKPGTLNKSNEELRELIERIYPDEEFWADVTKFAKKGNMQAARLRAEYRHGKPKEVIDATITVNPMDVATLFAQMVADSEQDTGTPRNQGVQDGPGAVQGGTRGPQVVQDGDGQATPS